MPPAPKAAATKSSPISLSAAASLPEPDGTVVDGSPGKAMSIEWIGAVSRCRPRGSRGRTQDIRLIMAKVARHSRAKARLRELHRSLAHTSQRIGVGPYAIHELPSAHDGDDRKWLNVPVFVRLEDVVVVDDLRGDISVHLVERRSKTHHVRDIDRIDVLAVGCQRRRGFSAVRQATSEEAHDLDKPYHRAMTDRRRSQWKPCRHRRLQSESQQRTPSTEIDRISQSTSMLDILRAFRSALSTLWLLQPR